MRRAGLALSMVAALAGPATAKEVVRAGVPIDSLTPEGMTRTDVTAPAAEGMPVRIAYAGEDGKPALVLDVLVARDAAGARAALETARRGVARTESAAERNDFGDIAFGGGRLIGFVEDNVMIVVRHIGEVDVAGVAEAALAAVEAAPTRLATKPAAMTFSSVSAAGGRSSGPRIVGKMVAAGADVVATRVTATGAGYARATGQALWSVVRTADGAIAVRGVAVDAFLRVRHGSLGL